MRFLSIFSGIEAASVAWKPLGWQCVGVAEIDPFPCAVLAHHYPDVPNLGSVTDITDERIAALGPIDVVVGGSPCQDLSVAGKRAGLAGERSGLFHEQLRIFHAARHLCGARFLLWENVPGAFSSHGGRDFAVVVGAMAGCRVAVPKDGWGTEGVALGEHGLVEWAVLDAQWFGVAQRRRRVFAVLDVGDWAGRPPILLEPDRLRGDSAPSREEGERVAPVLAGCSNGGGSNGPGRDVDSVESLQVISMAHGQAGAEIGFDRGPTLTCNHEAPIIAHAPAVSATLVGRSSRGGGQTNSPGHNADESLVVAHTLRGEGFDASEDGTGRGTPLVPVVCPTLRAGGNRTGGDRPPGTDVDTCESLIPVAVDVWNQSIDGDVAATLNAESGAPNHSGPKVMVPVAIRTANTSANGHGIAENVAHTLDQAQGQCVAFAQNQRNEVRKLEVAGALAAEPGMKQQTYIAFSAKDYGADAGEIAPTLRSMGHDGSHANGGGQVAVAFGWQNSASQGDSASEFITPTLDKSKTPAVAVSLRGREGGGTAELGGEVQNCLRASGGGGDKPHVLAAMQVRRLTPVECSRLQGFQDDYLSQVPWRGKTPPPDGPMYKALGNSFAVPCVSWIGKRLQMVAEISNG